MAVDGPGLAAVSVMIDYKTKNFDCAFQLAAAAFAWPPCPYRARFQKDIAVCLSVVNGSFKHAVNITDGEALRRQAAVIGRHRYELQQTGTAQANKCGGRLGVHQL